MNYWKIQLISRSKNTANGFNVKKKNQFDIDFEMTSEFNTELINTLLHS